MSQWYHIYDYFGSIQIAETNLMIYSFSFKFQKDMRVDKVR